jgi:hypothetical protein
LTIFSVCVILVAINFLRRCKAMQERALNSWEGRRERAFAQSHLLNSLRGSFIALFAKLANDLSVTYQGRLEDVFFHLGGVLTKLHYSLLHLDALDFSRVENFFYGLELAVDDFLVGELDLVKFGDRVDDLIVEAFGVDMGLCYVLGDYKNCICPNCGR